MTIPVCTTPAKARWHKALTHENNFGIFQPGRKIIMSKRLFIGTIIAGLIAVPLIGVTSPVWAHGGATGVVKERMEMMKSLSEVMKQLKGMFQNKATYDAKKVRKAAQAIKSHGGEKLTKLFPKGSLHKPTEALPAIWKDWDQFKTLANNLSAFATSLEAAAGNSGGPGQGHMMMGGGMMGGAGADPESLKSMPAMASFMQITRTCSSCHTDFRMKKDK
jgi:cytochrome c556